MNIFKSCKLLGKDFPKAFQTGSEVAQRAMICVFLIDAADLKAQGKYMGFFLASVISKTLHLMRFLLLLKSYDLQT